MFEDAFIQLEEEESRQVLQAVNPNLDGSAFEPAQATVMAQDLSFYPGYRFLDIANYESVHRFEDGPGVFDYAIMQYYPLGNLSNFINHIKMNILDDCSSAHP